MTSVEMPRAAQPGTVLGGRYRVERALGQGGMGIVLEGTHLELGKRVAIKLLLARPQEATIARFRREAQVASQLVSPHVAQVLDSGSHEDLPFLVMELLEGHDLQKELSLRGRLPIPEAVDWVLEASAGLAQAHALGLVHRDVKPANLFLAQVRPGRRLVKVLDFGLLKDGSGAGKSLTASAEVFGTPQYMAPEQIQSSKNVDPRCDQHALALVLYELLAGRPVYDAETLPQLIVNIAMQPPTPLGQLVAVPPGLEAAVMRALSKRPDERFAHLGALAVAVAPFGGARAAELAHEVAASLGAAAPAEGAGGDHPLPGGATAPPPAPFAHPSLPHPSLAHPHTPHGADAASIPLGTLSAGAMSQRSGEPAPPPPPGLAASAAPPAARSSSSVLAMVVGAAALVLLGIVGLLIAFASSSSAVSGSADDGAAPTTAAQPAETLARAPAAPSPAATAPAAPSAHATPTRGAATGGPTTSAPPAAASSTGATAAPSAAAAPPRPPSKAAAGPPPRTPPPKKACTGLDCY